jgi:hypothetical protein
MEVEIHVFHTGRRNGPYHIGRMFLKTVTVTRYYFEADRTYKQLYLLSLAMLTTVTLSNINVGAA